MPPPSDEAPVQAGESAAGADGLIPYVWRPAKVWVDRQFDSNLGHEREYVCYSSPILGSDWMQNVPVIPKGMLERFLNIESASDVKRFTARFGPLRLCAKHDLPSTHPFIFDGRLDLDDHERSDYALCSPAPAAAPRFGPTDLQEPIDPWFDLVNEARRAVLLANYVIGEQDPWTGAEVRARPDWTIQGADLPQDPIAARSTVAKIVNRWVREGAVRPTLYWPAEDNLPIMQFGNDVFSGLALELALEVSRTRGLVACSGCGTFYRRLHRAPKAGQANYCESCREKGAGLVFRKRRQNGRIPS